MSAGNGGATVVELARLGGDGDGGGTQAEQGVHAAHQGETAQTGFKKTLAIARDHSGTQALLMVATIWALYSEDVRPLTPKGADPVFDVMLVIVFFIFLVEFAVILCLDGCADSFYLTLDFIAMVSLIPDMFFWDDLMEGLSGNTAADSLGVVEKKLDDADHNESVDMSMRMSDMITRKVIVIVLVMLIVLPYLESHPVDEFPTFGLDVCERHMAISGVASATFNSSTAVYIAQMPDQLLQLRIHGVDYFGPLTSRMGELRDDHISIYSSTSTHSSASFDTERKAMDAAWYSMGRTTFVIFMLGLGSVLFASDASKLASRIAVPLKKLSDDMAQVANLEIKNVDLEISTIFEVNQMQKSFGRMKTGLKSFVKFVPRMVVRNLLRAGKPTKLGMERKFITIFFSNISNFDEITGKLNTLQMMDLLGRYFHEMSLIIERTNGTLIEFVGDEILALWNAPQDVEQHQAVCCSAALEMQKRLVELQPEWRSEGWPDIDVRMGINSAQVFVGNLGAPDRMKYGVLGDGVNLAARLQMLNRRYDTKICMSQKTQDCVRVQKENRIRCLDVVAVKGKDVGIRTHQLMSNKIVDKENAVHDVVADRYSDAMALYLAREFQKAADVWDDLAAELKKRGQREDKATSMLRARCAAFIESPPDDSWDGVEHLKSKHF